MLLQRRNLRILYDAIGTLADAVGSELNNVSRLVSLLRFGLRRCVQQSMECNEAVTIL